MRSQPPTQFQIYMDAAKQWHGTRFSQAGLALKFVRYYDSGERIKVRFSTGEVATGTVCATSGWQPVFILLRARTSWGSRHTLNLDDEVIAVQRNGRYVPVQKEV